MTRRASPSAPMISIASTQLRTLPLRTERGPAALVATMPPDVANAPEDGSGGSRRPKGRARSEERRVGKECRSGGAAALSEKYRTRGRGVAVKIRRGAEGGVEVRNA